MYYNHLLYVSESIKMIGNWRKTVNSLQFNYPTLILPAKIIFHLLPYRAIALKEIFILTIYSWLTS